MKAVVYESNAGTLNMYAFDDDGNQVWGASYDGSETSINDAVAEYTSLKYDHYDPVKENWGFYDAEEMPDYNDEHGTMIANTFWDDDVNSFGAGHTGMKFIEIFKGFEW